MRAFLFNGKMDTLDTQPLEQTLIIGDGVMPAVLLSQSAGISDQ